MARSQLLSSSLAGDWLSPGSLPSVHRQSRLRFRRPATGVCGQVSLSSSDSDESRLSPALGAFRGRGALSIVTTAGFCVDDKSDSEGLLSLGLAT